MAEYLLPDVGEGLTEAEIVSWKVKVGDTVEINDIVVEIETAKSLVELPSPYAGTVTGLLVPEGESLVGRNKVDRGAVRRARKAAATAQVSAGATAAHLQAQGAFEPGPSPDVDGSDEPAVPATSARTATDTAPAEARALAKPPVRKLAKDLGVDITTLTPSGPKGTVTREDVEQAAAGSGGVQAPERTRTAATGDRERREPTMAPSGSPSTSPGPWSSSRACGRTASSARSRSLRCSCSAGR